MDIPFRLTSCEFRCVDIDHVGLLGLAGSRQNVAVINHGARRLLGEFLEQLPLLLDHAREAIAEIIALAEQAVAFAAEAGKFTIETRGEFRLGCVERSALLRHLGTALVHARALPLHRRERVVALFHDGLEFTGKDSALRLMRFFRRLEFRGERVFGGLERAELFLEVSDLVI
jgi:hypothetical protein